MGLLKQINDEILKWIDYSENSMKKAIIVGHEPIHYYFANQLSEQGDIVISIRQNVYSDPTYQENCFAELTPAIQKETLSDLKKNQVLASCLTGIASEKMSHLFSDQKTFEEVETLSNAVDNLGELDVEKVLIFGEFDLAPCLKLKASKYLLQLGETHATVYNLLSDTKGVVVAKCEPTIYSSDQYTDLLFRLVVLGTEAMKDLSSSYKEEVEIPHPGLQKTPSEVIHSFRTQQEKRTLPSYLEYSGKKKKGFVIRKPPAFKSLSTKAFLLNVYYHGLFSETPSPFVLENSLSLFVKHMEFLRAHFPILSLHEAANKHFDETIVTVSFDDGFASVYHLAYPHLKELEIPFTLFINPAFLDENDFSWEVKWNLIQHKGGFGSDPHPSRMFRENFEIEGIEKIEHLFQELHNGECQRIYLTAEQVEEMSPLADVGNHTLSHYPLWRLNREQQQQEIIEGQRQTKQFSRYVPLLATPYGRADRETEKISDQIGEQLVLVGPQQMLQKKPHLWRAPLRSLDPEDWLIELINPLASIFG